MALRYTWNKGKHRALTSEGLHGLPASHHRLTTTTQPPRPPCSSSSSPDVPSLHLLFPLSGITASLLFSSLRFYMKCHLFRQALPDYQIGSHLRVTLFHSSIPSCSVQHLADVTLSVCSKNKNSTRARTIPAPPKHQLLFSRF